MLASLCGLGLFLAGGSAQAQTWAPAGTQPSASPYGTWCNAPPVVPTSPSSWRDSSTPMPPAPQGTGSWAPKAGEPAAVVAPQDNAALPRVETLPANAVLPKQADGAIERPAQPAGGVAEPQSYVIERARFQPPFGPAEERRLGGEPTQEQTIQLEPPGPERLFRLESEAALDERMRQEGLNRIPRERINFPEEPIVSREEYPGRHWPPMTELAEPNYVCYKRLLFEDKNAERYGWDFGILQPILSAAYFYADVVTLPYHLGTSPCRCYDCSSGLCLPGDPVPYLIYPPELSLTGALAEAGTVAAVLAIFP
jgi:hypothetical protein